MKKIAILLFFFSSLASAQEILPIKARVVSEITGYRPIGPIDIYLEEGWQHITADEKGHFQITPKQKKNVYKLTIYAGSHKVRTYEYKLEWTKRKHPKSIVVFSSIKASKEIAMKDFRKGELKLYIMGGIAPTANSKKDKRIEKKYNFTYYDLGCEAATEEAVLEYNERAIMILRLKHGQKWVKHVRKDIVGYDKWISL